MRTRSHNARGVTLIELILVIAIVALLLALTLPSLAGVWGSARDAASLGNMRQHAAVFAAYAGDWDDYSPYPVDPDATYSVFRGGDLVVTVEYFWATELWQIALADAYYDGTASGPVFRHPGNQNSIASYNMTSSYLAAPKYWVDEPDRDVSLWGGVRVSATRFPSQKAWLVEFHPKRGIPFGVGEAAASATGVGLAGVDGHADRADAPELTTPLQHGDGVVEHYRFGPGVFGMHTPDGVYGRDWK